MIKKVLAAASLACCALGAQAVVTASVAVDQNPSTFLTLGANVAGGNLYADSQSIVYNPPYLFPVASRPGTTSPAVRTTSGDWLAVGPNDIVSSSATLTLDASATLGVGSVSFLWGSPDAYNDLWIGTVGGGVYEFNSLTLGLAGMTFNGEGESARYVTFTTDDPLDGIVSLSFGSTSNAFEASNFSVTPVPEPETYALMLAGLGVVGFMARRRRAA